MKQSLALFLELFILLGTCFGCVPIEAGELWESVPPTSVHTTTATTPTESFTPDTSSDVSVQNSTQATDDPQETGSTEATEPIPTESATKETEYKPAETAPTSETHSETLPSETKPLETQPADPEPLETQPSETQPTETEPAETEPPQQEETQPVQTEPPGCAHEWVSIHHPEEGHWVAGVACDCGWTVYGDPAELTSLWNAHSASFPALESLLSHGGYGSVDQWIVDSPAYKEWVCAHCGEPKP